MYLLLGQLPAATASPLSASLVAENVLELLLLECSRLDCETEHQHEHPYAMFEEDIV
jgi:hypothetical protein